MSTKIETCSWIVPEADITNGYDPLINTYFDVLHCFVSDRTEDEIYLKISADSNYSVHLNGHFIGTGQYSDHPKEKTYDSYEITPFLYAGNNKLIVTWYYIGEDSSVYIAGSPRLFFSVDSKYGTITNSSSISSTYIRRSPAYLSGPIEKITPQMFFSCRYDARNDIESDKDWIKSISRIYDNCPAKRPVSKCTFEDIKPAVICAQGVFANIKSKSTGTSISNTPAQRMQTAFMSSHRFNEVIDYSSHHKEASYLPSETGIRFINQSYLTLQDGIDGIYLIIDLAEEDAGYITLDIEAPGGTDVDISFGEHLDDMRIRSFIGGRHFALRYTCGSGRNMWTDYFRRSGLRYLQLNIHSHDFTLYYAGIHPTHYPVRIKSLPEIPDALDRKIHDIGIRTLQLCMHDHYEDCPWREQALYTMDSRNQILTGYYCFDNMEFVRANIDLMAKGLRNDGLLELCFPGKVPITIPGFSLMFIVIIEEYLTHNSDTDFASGHFDTAKRVLDTFLALRSGNGLIPAFVGSGYWNFYEWTDGLDGARIETDDHSVSYDAPLNALLSAAARSFAKICGNIGKEAEASYYDQAHRSINNSLDHVYWSDKEKCYASFCSDNMIYHFSELTQSLLFFCDAIPASRVGTILEILSSNDPELIPISLSHSIFKYDALLSDKEKYAKFVLGDIRVKWGRMIERGATTFWETEDGADAFDFAGSLCHGWSAVPVYIFRKYFS